MFYGGVLLPAGVGASTGLAGGYLANKLFGPTEVDVVKAKMQKQKDAIEQATARVKARQAADAAEDEDDQGTFKTRSTRFSTAV